MSPVPGGTWLLRFGDKQPLDHLQRAAQDWKFQATLKPRLDIAEADWHAAQPPAMPPPTIINHPPEPGDSSLLGGAMEISAPWRQGTSNDQPRRDGAPAPPP